MGQIQPEFYGAFACKADRCRHSCCKGWEIDVDPASAALYRSLPGPLGEDLRAALVATEEGTSFRLTEDDRCPFLEASGLCRVISTLGEDALCDICALHPRFFQEVGGWELAGLGLSCERTCELLEEQPTLTFLAEDQPVDFPGVLALLGISAQAEQLIFAPTLSPTRQAALLDLLAETEPIDRDWPRQLENLRRRLPLAIPSRPDPWYQRVFQYLLYRQLERTREAGLPALLAYGRLCTEFLLLWDAADPQPTQHLRRWSEQIEYSTENVDRLLAGLSRLPA